MAAKRLEDKLRVALEHVYIDVTLIREGRSLSPIGERLDFARRNLEDAIAIQKRIDKREAAVRT
jgi:hypothetical protein